MSDPQATLPIELLNFQVIQPNEDHISLYFTQLAWAIEGKDPREEDQIGFIPPQVSRTFLECLDLEIKEDEHELCIERCKQLAQRMLQIKNLILVPVWGPGKGVNHFTLLALSKIQLSNSWEVSYYETLPGPKKINMERAQSLVHEFWGIAEQLPERKNKARQVEVECAFQVMHYEAS